MILHGFLPILISPLGWTWAPFFIKRCQVVRTVDDDRRYPEDQRLLDQPFQENGLPRPRSRQHQRVLFEESYRHADRLTGFVRKEAATKRHLHTARSSSHMGRNMTLPATCFPRASIARSLRWFTVAHGSRLRRVGVPLRCGTLK